MHDIYELNIDMHTHTTKRLTTEENLGVVNFVFLQDECA